MDAMTDLLEAVEAYIQRNDLTRSRFGMIVTGNHKLIARMESGAATWRTMQRVRAFIEGNTNGEG